MWSSHGNLLIPIVSNCARLATEHQHEPDGLNFDEHEAGQEQPKTSPKRRKLKPSFSRGDSSGLRGEFIAPSAACDCDPTMKSDPQSTADLALEQIAGGANPKDV